MSPICPVQIVTHLPGCTSAQPGQQPQVVQPPRPWNNVARLNLGVGFYNSGWYTCSDRDGNYGSCPSCSYAGLHGKWHLGSHDGRLPNDQGFDE